MKLKVMIHEAKEGGYWAEVPAIRGCMTQGQTLEELIENVYDAVQGCLSVDMDGIKLRDNDKPGLPTRRPIPPALTRSRQRLPMRLQDMVDSSIELHCRVSTMAMRTSGHGSFIPRAAVV
jgi:predicted RNase H-like HicB family nuclease